jgi:hypothetical protein
MKRIQLWSVDQLESGAPRALNLDEMASTETEQRLEELLVASPDLLVEGLNIVGRQLPTDAGFPDLLGVDQDGRLVVLELKRGTLTRDAVAQVLDYGSDLGEREVEELARLIEEHSGQAGVAEIEDFLDWHSREYPNDSEALKQTPRMILVGLGVDERAKRIVNFLAETGVDIQLLTFHAFNLDGRLLLAKQVETVAPSTPRSGSTGTSKQENLASLLALAEQHGMRDLLVEVADFIEQHVPCYRWPGKTAFSFSLQERTKTGSPTLRSYLTLYVHYWQKRRGLLLTLAPRARDAAAEAVARFVDEVPEATRRDGSSGPPVQVEITGSSWERIRPHLEELLQALVTGWQRRSAAEEADELREEEGVQTDEAG